MHTTAIARIRAHALALVQMARVQSDLELALQLEAVAVDLLKASREIEIKTLGP